MEPEHIQTDQVVDFVLGELEGPARLAFEARLTTSPELRRLVDEARSLVTALERDDSIPAPPELLRRIESLARTAPSVASPSWIRQAGRIVGELVFDSRRQPALGLRGGGIDLLTWESEPATVDVELARDAPWTIRGQLSDCDQRRGREVTLLLADTGEPVARTRTDERGGFSIETTPGAYELLVGLDPAPLLLRPLSIG